MSNAIQSIVLTPKIIKGIANQNQYAFNVNKKLKKPEIKQICEDIFNTKVISINTSILPQKKYRPNLKRALVKFEKIKPYSNLFQNIYLSNRLKTKLKLLKTRKPLSTINTLESSSNFAKKKKNNKTWLSTNEANLFKKNSNSIIAQTDDYSKASLMNILNFPDSFIDHFIKQKVENNKYQNVIDFHDWVFLMKNRLDTSFKDDLSNISSSVKEKITNSSENLSLSSLSNDISKENFLFKPLTQKDKTDFLLLQKTTTILKKKKEQYSRKPLSSSSKENNKIIKKKKKKKFLFFTFSFPLNQKLKLTLPLIKNKKFNLTKKARKNKPKQLQNKSLLSLYNEKKKKIETTTTNKAFKSKEASAWFFQKHAVAASQKKTKTESFSYLDKKPNLFLDILSKTQVGSSVPFSLPRSLPFLTIKSKLKTKSNLNQKTVAPVLHSLLNKEKSEQKKKFIRGSLRLKKKRKSKTSRQIIEFLNTIRSIKKTARQNAPTSKYAEIDNKYSSDLSSNETKNKSQNVIQFDNTEANYNDAWLYKQTMKTNKQRLLKKIEKKSFRSSFSLSQNRSSFSQRRDIGLKKKKFIALIPSFLWPHIIEYGKKKKKINLFKTTAKKQILLFSTKAMNTLLFQEKTNVDKFDIPEIKINKLSTFVKPRKKEKLKISNNGRLTPFLKTRLYALGKIKQGHITLGKRQYKNLIKKKTTKKNIFSSVKNFFGKILKPLRENRQKREQQKRAREIIFNVARYKIVLWLRFMRNTKLPGYKWQGKFEGAMKGSSFDQVTNFEFLDFKNKTLRYSNNDDKEDLLIMKALRRTEFFQKINNSLEQANIADWNFARINSKKIRLRRLKDTENYQRRILFRLQRRIIENDFFLRIFKMKPIEEMNINDLWEIADMSPYDRYINWSYIKTTWNKNNKATRNQKQENMLFLYTYKTYQKIKTQLKRKRQFTTSAFGGSKKKIYSNNKFNLNIGS